MQKYANVTCSKCFAIVPGNEITKVYDKISSGSSRSYSLDSNGNRRGAGGRETQHYKYRVSKYCPRCLRRRRFKQFLGISIIGSASLAFFSNPEIYESQEGSRPTSHEDSAADIIYPEMVSSSSPLADGNQEKKTVEEEEENRDLQPPLPSETTASNENSNSSPPISPETSDALSHAVQQAMKEGSSVRWEDGEYAGYVVVSSAQAQTGCRSMYYSIDRGTEWKSENSLICP